MWIRDLHEVGGTGKRTKGPNEYRQASFMRMDSPRMDRRRVFPGIAAPCCQCPSWRRIEAAAIQREAEPTKDIEQLFAPLRGLNLDFSRNPSTGRPIDL